MRLEQAAVAFAAALMAWHGMAWHGMVCSVYCSTALQPNEAAAKPTHCEYRPSAAMRCRITIAKVKGHAIWHRTRRAQAYKLVYAYMNACMHGEVGANQQSPFVPERVRGFASPHHVPPKHRPFLCW